MAPHLFSYRTRFPLKNLLFKTTSFLCFKISLLSIHQNHPYNYAGFASIDYLQLLKMERMDLVGRDLCKDIMDFKSRAAEEMKGLVKGLKDESDKILRWLKIVGSVTDNESVYSEFEDVDEELRNLMDLMAADFAVEDLICALDKIVRQGGVSFEVYIKEVRVLAREQYLHRAGIVKIVESWRRQKLGLDYFGMIMYGFCEKYFR
ncbi:hypothetical protein ACJIZ3_016804 [Penstemon smallii]|uniref:SB domain-containing protein n=1 Tax=Penstemon smallii TaxID=265156 RepID=A0ABD3STR7_9LAMI